VFELTSPPPPPPEVNMVNSEANPLNSVPDIMLFFLLVGGGNWSIKGKLKIN
jgi:hypothetical protein